MSAPYRPGDGLNAYVVTVPPNVHPRGPMTGNGSPEGVARANPGTGYTDNLTGHLWVKFIGVQELGWKDVGLPGPGQGSGGGTKQVFAGTGSPVGIVTPTADAAFYTQTDSTPPGLVWQWYGGVWH